MKIRDSRHEYAHSGVSISDRFPPVSVAEDAVAKIREAIRDIYTRSGKQIPVWVNLNAASGWPQTRGAGISSAFITVSKGGGNDPNRVSISLVTPTGKEHQMVLLPANAQDEDIADEVEQLLERLNAPIKEVRVYKGQNLFYKEGLDMRGI